MKKAVVVSIMFAVAGCASANTEEQIVYVETENVGVPCSYSCMQDNCPSAMPEPLVLKPRVTEVVSTVKKRRCCPCDTLQSEEQTQTIIPELPEIYVISANRTVNSMLNDTKAVFEDKPVKIFVSDTEYTAQDLPKGVEKGVQAIKKRLDNVSTIILASTPQKADYLLNSQVDWFDTPTKQVPAVKYTIELKSTDGIKIGEWTEVVHQADGDRSWW